MRRKRESPRSDKKEKVSPPQKKQKDKMDVESQSYWDRLKAILDSKLQPIKDDLKDLQSAFNNHVVEISERLSKLERETYRKNFVIRRLREEADEKPAETEKVVVRFLREGLRISEEEMPVIDNCVRMGKRATGEKRNGRHILLKLAFEKHKYTIFSHLKNLLTSPQDFKNVKVESQMSNIERAKRDQLLIKRKEAKQKGIQTKMTEGGLWIGKEYWTVTDDLKLEKSKG